MKPLIPFVLIVALLSACDKSKSYVSPSDKLYKRWKSVEIGKNGKDWREMTPTEVIEFAADGTVKYENQSFVCCSPTKLERKKNVLKVIKIGDSNAACFAVSCVAVSELHILALTDKSLVVDYWYEDASMYSVSYVAAP